MNENSWRARWSKAMQTMGVTRALILTDASADPITLEGMPIEIRAIAQWLLEQKE